MAGGVVDIHGILLPSVRQFPLTWQNLSVSEDDPTSLLQFATGQIECDADSVHAAITQAGEGAVLGAWSDQPAADFLPRYTLGQAPGVVLISDGLDVERTVSLYPGQQLLGIGPGAAGARIHWAGAGAGPVLTTARTQSLEAGNNRIEALRIECDAASLAGTASVGVEIAHAGEVVLSNVQIAGFGLGIALRGAIRCTIEHAFVDSLWRGIGVDATSKHCLVVGCHVVSSLQAGDGPATVIALNGHGSSIVRSRIEEQPAMGSAGGRIAGRLVRITGSDDAVVGCDLILQTRGEAAVTIGAAGAKPPSGTVFERNVYRPAGVSGSMRAAAPATRPPALVADYGVMTMFRDVVAAGFPPVSVSTRNLLANGSFEQVFSVSGSTGDGDAVVAIDPSGAAPVLPAAWSPAVAFPVGNDRARFVLDHPAAEPSADGGPAGPYFDFGSMPAFDDGLAGDGGAAPAGARETFRLRSFPANGAETDFELEADVHHGRRSLWLAVGPVATQDGEPFEAVFEQQLDLPRVSAEFVLSAFVKARGKGCAFVRILEPGHPTPEGKSAHAPRDAGWTQCTARYLPDESTGGPVRVTVQCVVHGSDEGPTQAFFDRMVLAAGCVVPHYSEACVADQGGEVAGGMRVRTGWATDVRLVTGDWMARLYEPGETLALAVVGAACELEDDLLVSITWSFDRTSGGAPYLDLRRNGRSFFADGAAHPLAVVAQPGRTSLISVPLARVRPEDRALKSGDVLSLHWTSSAPVAELQAVLTGRRRDFAP